MRVFLTGATGFCGSHLLAYLVNGGAHDVAILLREESDPWRIAETLPSVTVVHGDLGRLERWQDPVASFAPEVFLHLAWWGVAAGDRNSPVQARNIDSALETVNLCHRIGTRHWIGLGSQAEYGPCPHAIDEDQVTRPTTLYGMAKLCTCQMAGRLCQELGMEFTWLRLFSSYGPTDHETCMIPYLIRALLRGERPATTAGEQRWDYVHVEDVAEAILQAAERQALGVFNLGSGTVHTIREVIEVIRDLVDPDLPVGFGEAPYDHDQVMHLEPVIGRFEEATGWSARTSLADGLTRTVEWYREHGLAHQEC